MSILIYGSIWWLLIFFGVFSLSFVPGAAIKKDNQFIFTSKGLLLYFVFVSIVSLVIGYVFHLKNSGIRFGFFGLSVCLISIFLDSIITCLLYTSQQFAPYKRAGNSNPCPHF